MQFGGMAERVLFADDGRSTRALESCVRRSGGGGLHDSDESHFFVQDANPRLARRHDEKNQYLTSATIGR